MAGSRITADEHGALRVPPDPLIPFIEGDVPGPELWRATKRVVDAAVEKAFKGTRRIHWVEVVAGEKAMREQNDPVPDATLNAIRIHRVALKGPVFRAPGSTRHVDDDLREILDLSVTILPLRLPAALAPRWKSATGLDVTLVREEREDAGAGIDLKPGSPTTFDLVGWLESEQPEALAQLKFASPAVLDAWREAQDLLATGLAETGFHVRSGSRLGTERVVLAAIDHALRTRRARLTIAGQEPGSNAVDRAFVEWAYDAAERRPEVASARHRPEKKASPERRLQVDDRDAARLIGELTLTPGPARVIVASYGAAEALVRVLAPLVGGLGALAAGRLNPLTGHAVFETRQGALSREAPEAANPVGFMRAAELMLGHLGWPEAAALIRTAVDDTLVSGAMTSDLAHRLAASGARILGASAFGQEVAGRLAGERRSGA